MKVRFGGRGRERVRERLRVRVRGSERIKTRGYIIILWYDKILPLI